MSISDAINPRQVTCSNCGNVFLKKSISKVNPPKNHFCNRDCQTEYRRSQTPILICTECKVEYRGYKDKRVKNNFCSQSCGAIYNNRYTPKRLPEGACISCSKVISKRNKYCKTCFTSDFLVDWSQVTYEEVVGKRKYQKHSRIRALARSWYEKSNNPKYCMCCGYDKAYQVAHIQEVGSHKPTDTVAYINRPENLLALCIRCHWEFDKLDLTLEEIQKSKHYTPVS